MALRKALAYSKKKARPNTRTSKKKSKAYVRTVPFSKIVKFSGGDLAGYREGKHTHSVKLVSEQWAQIRDNALEACRMFITKQLDTNAPGQYYLEVRVHPHHLLRENKSVAAVAGADRLSSGMTQSFGVVIGRAAIVAAGKDIFAISCANEKTARTARDALSMIKSKVPCKTKVVFEKVKQK